ncbi:MAG: right-handed parallel beta-helix repeat-containing protein [Deltaproteobacteria bacterium]|nr:right-handed parallel beta-helix repeat-containing protein [Deltaproteobacteria bacterium]
MTRLIVAALLAALGTTPAAAGAASAVFAGDPTDPGSGAPYEILPGKPLVRPGLDHILGTGDDVVDASIVGDIDLVVRTGTRDASPVIPPPALGGADPPTVGIAGPRNAGGSEVPFTVFLSDGITSGEAPAGRRLAAADMDGHPVIVAAFADLDGDGMIGPTAGGGGSAQALRLRELLPVGRAAALCNGGVARGAIAVQRGLPPSQGGLRVVLTALALTGPFDAAVFDGAIPSGPAIATALPFLPQRDLTRMIRDRAVPAGPATTLQSLVQFAAVPAPGAYALPLDGSEPTIDGAIVHSQPAVRVALRDGAAPRDVDLPLEQLTLGTEGAAGLLRLRLVGVDRFDNPADAATPQPVRILADGPLRLLSPRLTRRGAALMLRRGSLRVAGRVPPDTADGAAGTIRVERDGVVVATLPYTVRAAANRPRADLVVPSSAAATIQAGIDAATDRDGDGHIVVAVRPGLYREAVAVRRFVDLIGAGRAQTILLGDGSAPVVEVLSPGSLVSGVTAIGGWRGVELGGASTRLFDVLAWRNGEVGLYLGGADTDAEHATARENGGDGVHAFGAGARCDDVWSDNNTGNGGSSAGAGITWRGTRVTRNGLAGITLLGGGPTVADSACVANDGDGLSVLDAPSATLADNLCALNDEDGLRIESSDDAVVVGNTLDDNHRYGLFLRRSANTDFSRAAGAQPPPGDNGASGNRRGDVFVRPD